MGLCSDIYAQQQQQKQINTKPKQQPVIAQKPIAKRQAHILNPVADVVRGVQQAIPQLPNMAVDFGKSAVNNLTPSGLGNTIPAVARGIATGAVDFAPSIAGLGVDVVNSIAGKPVINMPEERRRPLGYALEQWRDIQDTQNNLAIPSYHGQNPADLGIKPANKFAQYISGNTPGADKAQFAEMLGSFAVPMGTVKKGADAVKAIQKANNVAKEAKRIASKLDDVKKAKYATQINKLAEKNVSSKVAPKTFGQELASNTMTGAGLGALEGSDLQERATNATGGAALGAGLSAVHAGGKKAWNSSKGQQLRNNVKEGLNLAADEIPGLSQTMAFIDNAFKTNLSKKGSITETRKKYYDMLSENNNLKRNMTDEMSKILEETGELTSKEEKRLYNINRIGREKSDKSYQEQKQNQQTQEQPQFNELVQEQNTQQNIQKNLVPLKDRQKYKQQQETQPVESNLTPVKEQSNINLPKKETSAVKNDSGMANEENIKRLPSGKAEGADSLYKFTKGEENIYKDTVKENNTGRSSASSYSEETIKGLMSKYEVMPDGKTIVYKTGKKQGKRVPDKEIEDLRKRLENEEIEQEEYINREDSYEDEYENSYDKHRDNISEERVEEQSKRFATDDAGFIDWYDRYSKSSDNAKNKMLKRKLDSIKSKKELDDFSKKFVEQENRENNLSKAKKIGDEYYDTSDVSETEHLTRALDETDKVYEKEEPVEEIKKGRSTAFQKVIDKIWNERTRVGKHRGQYTKGRLMSARDSKTAQELYDKTISDIKNSKQSANIKQALIEDVNKYADEVMEAKKRFDVKINKVKPDIVAEILEGLKNANETGDLAKGREIIESNQVKSRYSNSEIKEALSEHYMQSVNNFHKQIGEMGLTLKTNKNGKKVLMYNAKKARAWCEEQIRKQYANNPEKMVRELRYLKRDAVVKERVRNRYTLLFNQNKNIIFNDTKYAYDNPQYTIKEKAVKGTDKRYVREGTGDTWSRESSDVTEGEVKANATIRALEKGLTKDVDNTKPGLGQIGKELAKVGKVIDLKTASELFKNVKLPDSVTYLFNKYKKQGITVVTKDSRTGFNYKTGELFVKQDPSTEVMASKIAHELGHKEIYDAISEGGKLAVKVAYDVLGEKLSPEEAVKALKKAINENVEANNNYSNVLKELNKKYGEDFVEEAKRDAEALRESGKTTRSLITDKRKIWKEIQKALPITKVERYCNNIERSVLNEFRTRQQLGDRGRLGNNLGLRENDGVSTKREGNRSERKQENLESDSKEGRPKRLNNDDIWEGTEYSATSHKIFDFFKKNNKDKSKETINKINEDLSASRSKVNRIADVFQTINDSREKDFREFGTYASERMKNRLKQQAYGGEGVYFMQSGKRSKFINPDAKKNEKSGFLGHKEKYGINKKGTMQQSLANGLSDEIKRASIRKRVEFLKEFFGEPKEGYVPANSKLLWNAMYFGKSKAFYNEIRKGKDNIAKIFDEKDVKDWQELYDTTNASENDIYVPKDILDISLTGEKELPLDYLRIYGRNSAKGKLKGMIKLASAFIDWRTDRFKRKVLTSGSFFANNRFGNQIMLTMNSDNLGQYVKSIFDAKKLKEGDVPREILESTLAEAINNETNGRVRRYFSEDDGFIETASRIMDGDYVDLKSVNGLKKLGYGLTNALVSLPNDLFKRLSKFTGEINERFERFERKQAASIVLSKMQKQNVLKTAKGMQGINEIAKLAEQNPVLRQTVIDRVGDILGDYNNFNKYEKTYLKKLFPFYAWNRTITRHIISLCKDNPVKATLVMYETYRLLNQDDGLEDYQHGAIKTPFQNKRTGTNVIINKTNMIPYNTLFEMLSGESIGSLNPIITKPIEAVKGEKFFKPASEITSKKWKRATQNKVKGYYNNYTGEFREGGLPLGARLGYLAKDQVEAVYPMLGSPMTKGTVDAIRHKWKTGEFLFPDKQYDADLGNFYNNDVAGIYTSNGKTRTRKLSAKNRLDLPYQLLNKYAGLGIQPERAKEEVRKRKAKFKKAS